MTQNLNSKTVAIVFALIMAIVVAIFGFTPKETPKENNYDKAINPIVAIDTFRSNVSNIVDNHYIVVFYYANGDQEINVYDGMTSAYAIHTFPEKGWKDMKTITE